MNITIVTAGIIFKDDKLLIAQRKEKGNQMLKWEFPGGKLEENEEPEEGLKREILEELGIEIDVMDIFDVVYHKYTDINILLLCYTAKHKSGKARTIDCKAYEWIDRKDIMNYDFSEADKRIRDKLNCCAN